MTAGEWYVRIFVCTAAVILGGVAAINLLIDPYDVSRIVRLPRINAEKVREHGFGRLRKPFDLWRRHYDGVALGSSQVERGIDPDNPALAARGLTLYNAGLSEERPFEQALLLQHAVEVSGIRFALISLDFLRYMGEGGRVDFMPRDWNRWQALSDYLKTLVSYSALIDSTATIAASWSSRTALQHSRNGLLNVEEFQRTSEPSTRPLFESVDGLYLNTVYPRALKARTTEDGFDHTPLRNMLRIARETGVRLYFFIGPSHARQFEIIHLLGLSHLYQQWMRELVIELAAGNDSAGFPLWDFSGYNSVTTELVPSGEANTPMHWYFDSVHYTPAAGNLVQERMLGLPSENSDIIDFGTEITVGTLDAHFDAIAHTRQKYLAANPAFLPDLARLHHPSEAAAFGPPKSSLQDGLGVGSK